MRKRLWRQAREEAGLCIQCGEPRLPESSRCGRCLDGVRDYFRRKRGSKRAYRSFRTPQESQNAR